MEPGSSHPDPTASVHYTRFLAGIYRSVPDPGRLRVLQVAPLGKDGPLERFRLEHPLMQFDESATIDHWRLAASHELAVLGRTAPMGSPRGGRAEPARSLRTALQRLVPGKQPFEWTAERGEIARGEALYRLRYRLAVTPHEPFKSPKPDAMTMSAGKSREESARLLARSVLGPYLRVARGERVTIDTWTATLPEANAMVLEALRRNARPLLLYQDEPTYWAAASEVTPSNLAPLGSHRRAAIAGSDVFVTFFGPSDRERWHALPEATMLKLCAFDDAVYEAARHAGARGVQLALGRVSPASARMYGIEEGPWRRELLDASLVSPKELHRTGAGIVDRLKRGHRLEVRHPNGTSISLRLRGCRPELADGLVHAARTKADWQLATLPAGVVTVAVDESFAEGTFRSNLASSVGLSDTVGEMEGGRWEFRGGRLVSHSHAKGGEFFHQSYAKAGSGRDRVGTFAIGLNPSLHRAPLLEDQGLGTVTLSIGRNNHLGGRTKADWWAWMFLEGADVEVDGKPLLTGGRLGGLRKGSAKRAGLTPPERGNL